MKTSKMYYNDYKRNYFPITLTADDGYEFTLSIPLRNYYPIIVFPNDPSKIRKMISRESVIWYVNHKIVLSPRFRKIDQQSILFGKIIADNYVSTIEKFLVDHSEAITIAQKSVTKKKSSILMYNEFFRDKIKEEHIKEGIANV